MVTITSAQSGDWSATSTWVGGVVPVNGNDVVIASEHDVIFNVIQSGFATGIATLTINGNLIHSATTKNYLKVAGNITGTGKWWIGTAENPILRPETGDTVFCNIMFGASNTYSVQYEIHGEVPNRVHSFLAEDSALGNNQLKVVDDLDLRTNDKISVGSKEVVGNLTETVKGIYTVQSYDSATKIITLTTNLQTKRYADDLILSLSRSVQIERVSGTTAYHLGNKLSNIVMKGTYIVNGGYWISSVQGNDIDTLTSSDLYFEGVSSSGRLVVATGKNVTIKKSIYVGSGFAFCSGMIGALNIENCYSIHGAIVYGAFNEGIVKNCITQNALSLRATLVKDSIIKNVHTIICDYGGNDFDNCEFDGDLNGIIGVYLYNNLNFKNCTFKANTTGYMQGLSTKLYNCLFEAENGAWHIDNNKKFRPYDKVESFNHNRIEGNYYSRMRGGKIETENNKLKFICESADYPVFRDYPILAPANRTIKKLIGLTKSTSEIVTKLQFIDPSNDPLIDSSATPLAESSEIVNNQIGVAYKSDTPKQIILRIFCQNSSGNVIIDTTRIDQSLAKRI